MKKLLLTGICFVMIGVGSALAQALPTARVTYGEHQTDIKASGGGNQAHIDFSNTRGSERAGIDIQEVGNETQIIAKDKNTGKVISQGRVVKDKEADIVWDAGGVYNEMHLQKTGPDDDDMSGSIKHKSQGKDMDVQFGNGNPTGHIFDEEEGQYIYMYADGSVKVEYRDKKTKELLYTMTGTEEYSKVYDAAGKLIAEGPDESNATVYDKAAYQKFMALDNDDEDEEPEDMDFNLEFLF